MREQLRDALAQHRRHDIGIVHLPASGRDLRQERPSLRGHLGGGVGHVQAALQRLDIGQQVRQWWRRRRP